MSKSFPLFLIFVLFFSSCTKSVIIDNPTNSNVSISIDKQEFELETKTSKDLQLKKGPHDLIVKAANDSIILDTSFEVKNDGFINFSQSSYVLWTLLYCEEVNYEKYIEKLDIKDLVVVDSLEYEEVDFIVLNDIYLEKNWDLDIKDNFPEEIDLKNEKFLIKSKLYRAEDLELEFGYFGGYDFTNFTEKEIEAFIDSLKATQN